MLRVIQAAIVSTHWSKRSENHIESQMMITAELTWPFVQLNLCYPENIANQITRDAIVDNASWLRDEDPERFDSILALYMILEASATVEDLLSETPSNKNSLALFCAWSHLKMLEKKDTKYSFYDRSTEATGLKRSKMNNCSAYLLVNLISLTHRSTITEKSLKR